MHLGHSPNVDYRLPREKLSAHGGGAHRGLGGPKEKLVQDVFLRKLKLKNVEAFSFRWSVLQ